MGSTTDQFVKSLTGQHRVMVLGGLAVIAHGFSRSTYDGDIWLATKGAAWLKTARSYPPHSI